MEFSEGAINMNIFRFLSLFGVSLLLLTGCSDPYSSDRKVTDFQFIDQHGDDYGTKQLEGKVWMADFIFTHCETVCPPMTIEMARLQQEFKEKELDVTFVSFSVDPELDTPSVLQNYLTQFTEDDSNWHLLTGFSQDEITTFAREQFQTIVQKPATSNQVIHGTNFYLVDKNGYIVREYNYADTTHMSEMAKDIERLLKR